MLCEQHFFELYKRGPQDVAFCPYRICPIGAHSDHQYGKVTGLAIDKGIYLASQPRSHWTCPPFYCYTRENAGWIGRGIDSGCGTDAPGSYLAWLCANAAVHAMIMPGRRYDIGNLESYEKVCRTFAK